VLDHASAIWAVCTRGRLDEGVYNIGAESEIPNIEIVRALLRLLGRPESLIRFVNDRLGHDRRYAMNITKIRTQLAWAPQHRFAEGLRDTVDWYVANERWWRRVQSEAYRASQALYLASISS
jgi:dTDP-glucose 4,6-dehydratase